MGSDPRKKKRRGEKVAKRVVLWGTGFVGKLVIPGILRHPALELVGVGVSTPAKVGRDVGAFPRAGIDVCSTAMTPWVWPAMTLNPPTGPLRSPRPARRVARPASLRGSITASSTTSMMLGSYRGSRSGLACTPARWSCGESRSVGSPCTSAPEWPLLAAAVTSFADRGEHEHKGVPGNWRLFAVEG